MHRILLFLMVAALGWSTLAPAATADVSPSPVIDLNTPDDAARQVDAASQAKYRQMVASYAAAVRAHPDDATLALARCNFMQRFAWSEDLAWADDAGLDFTHCQQDLRAKFAAVPAVALYLLEHVYGKEAIEQGTRILRNVDGWSLKDQARVHAALSRAYDVTKDKPNAGLQAVAAAQQDPDTPVMLNAVRYLADTGRKDDAKRLLMSAPVPKQQWTASGRINVAFDVLPSPVARDLLLRTQHAGIKVDPYTTARALLQTGDVVGAHRALADVAKGVVETPQNRALRLFVALNAGDVPAASAALQQSLEKETGSKWPLAQSYAQLLRLNAAAALRPSFLLLLAILMAVAMTAVLMPGVVMFPAHYVGVVRARKGKVTTPLFDGIGLRQAWFAWAVIGVALFVVALLVLGQLLSAFAANIGNMPVWQPRLAVAHAAALGFAALGLAWVARRLRWRDWLGTGPWQAKWAIGPGVLIAYAALTGWASTRHAPTAIGDHAIWVDAMARGAAQMGGIGLALLLIAVAVPIIEEFVFRGCVLGGLSRHMSFAASNLVQSLIFAGMHFDPKHFLFYTVIGLTAGWLVRKTRGLAMPILLHACVNGIFVIATLARA